MEVDEIARVDHGEKTDKTRYEQQSTTIMTEGSNEVGVRGPLRRSNSHHPRLEEKKRKEGTDGTTRTVAFYVKPHSESIP